MDNFGDFDHEKSGPRAARITMHELYRANPRAVRRLLDRRTLSNGSLARSILEQLLI